MLRSRIILCNLQTIVNNMVNSLNASTSKMRNTNIFNKEKELTHCLLQSHHFEFAVRYHILHKEYKPNMPIPSPLKSNLNTQPFYKLLAEANFRLIQKIQKNPEKALEYLDYLNCSPKINIKTFHFMINNAIKTKQRYNNKQTNNTKHMTLNKKQKKSINIKQENNAKTKEEIENIKIQNIFLSVFDKLNEKNTVL